MVRWQDIRFEGSRETSTAPSNSAARGESASSHQISRDRNVGFRPSDLAAIGAARESVSAAAGACGNARCGQVGRDYRPVAGSGSTFSLMEASTSAFTWTFTSNSPI